MGNLPVAFDDLQASVRMRNIIEGIATGIVNKLRPQYRYGTVFSIDLPNNQCEVTLNGQTGTITANMMSIQPAGTGQRVRVAGIGNDRYIDDVQGPVKMSESVTLANMLATVFAAGNVKWGASSLPVGAGGLIVVNHTLGNIPNCILTFPAVGFNAGYEIAQTNAHTATTFTVHIVNRLTGADGVSGQPAAFYYLIAF